MLLLVCGLSARTAERPFTIWSQYLGGADSSQYSSLKQINKSNVTKLDVAWTYPTGPGPFVFDPIVVDGVVYVLAQNNSQPNSIVALDAATGKELWAHPNTGAVGTRGMNYRESKDRSDRRLFYINAGFRPSMRSGAASISRFAGRAVTASIWEAGGPLRMPPRRPAPIWFSHCQRPGKLQRFRNRIP